MSVWAVIPLKSPESAKSRLRGVLDGQQRLRLFYALARRVIDATLHTPGIDGVSVVTASDAVVDFAISLGAQCLRLESDRGTADACSEALEKLPAHCVKRVLFIAGDIPLVSSRVLAPFVALSDHSPVVAIAADRRHIGTNALLCAPGHAIPLCFGSGSFAQHVAAAARLGITTHVVDSEPLALDIDEPGDLREWQRRLIQTGQPMALALGHPVGQSLDAELSDLFAAREEAVRQ